MVHELADEHAADHGAELLGGADRRHRALRAPAAGGARLTDMFTGEDLGTVDDLHSFSLALEAYQGTSLHINTP